jgi:hypothetical protein
MTRRWWTARIGHACIFAAGIVLGITQCAHADLYLLFFALLLGGIGMGTWARRL